MEKEKVKNWERVFKEVREVLGEDGERFFKENEIRLRGLNF